MALGRNFSELIKNNRVKAVVVLGIVGIMLLFLSSFGSKKSSTADEREMTASVQPELGEEYRIETEERLEAMLEKIDGAGDVEVYISVGTGQRRVYATEKKISSTDSRRDEEEKYVMAGGDRTPLICQVETPEITGAVVVCSGGNDPRVAERMYRAVSAALGIPTMNIYVTYMK